MSKKVSMYKKNHDDGRWKTIASEYLFRRPWLTVRRDTVQLPNGVVNPEFYVLEYPSWVNVIAVTADGRHVMVRQYRHGLDDTRYELCAGVVEEGEDPEVAARRELAEETGYTGGTWTLLSVISGNPSVTNNLTYCFVAEGVECTQCQQLDTTEDMTVELLTADDLLQLLHDDEMKQSLMAAPLWKYFYQKLKR